MRKDALSQNLMRHQILQPVLLWGSLGSFCKRPNPWDLVLEKLGSGKPDDAIESVSTRSKNPETLVLTHMQWKTVYLTILLANLLSIFTVSTARRSLNARCDPLSSILRFGTEPNASFKSRSN